MKTLPTTLSVSTARANFYQMLEEVSKKLKRFTITKHGTAQAVIINPEEIEEWEETLEIMSNKKLVRDIEKAERDRLVGKGITHEELMKKLKISPKDLET